jgi:hypothetical protein
VAVPAAFGAPASMDEAIQQGDPAATAPSVEIGGGNAALFEDQPASFDTAASRGGACLVDERPVARCYRSEQRAPAARAHSRHPGWRADGSAEEGPCASGSLFPHVAAVVAARGLARQRRRLLVPG